MALQRGLTPAPALMALAPALVLLPLGMVLLHDLHGGGAEQIGRFWLAALQPSLEPSLLKHQLMGLTVLRPGETYEHRMLYRFSAE